MRTASLLALAASTPLLAYAQTPSLFDLAETLGTDLGFDATATDADAVLIPIGTGDGETTYLLQETVVDVDTTHTIEGTIVASASGYKITQFPTDSVVDIGIDSVECTIDGQGGAGCVYVGEVESSGVTTTFTATGVPVPLRVELSSSSVEASAEATSGGSADNDTGSGGNDNAAMGMTSAIRSIKSLGVAVTVVFVYGMLL